MNYRHGDLALIGIDRLPEYLIQSPTMTLMTGRGGNHHMAGSGKVYLKSDNQQCNEWGGKALVNLGATGIDKPESIDHIGYFSAPRGCELYHPDHGENVEKGTRVAEIDDGFYALLKQMEDTNDGMKPVVD